MKLTDETQKEADDLGYTTLLLHYGHFDQFVKEHRYIWAVCETHTLTTKFQTANLRDGYYEDHVKFNTLKEALNRPL